MHWCPPKLGQKQMSKWVLGSSLNNFSEQATHNCIQKIYVRHVSKQLAETMYAKVLLL